MKTIHCQQRLDVHADYDVIVAGAGPAGICAAVAAARQGAKVALVERYGVVGGNLTAGYVGPILGMVGRGTMRDELVRLLGVPDNDMIGITGKAHDIERAKCVLAELIARETIDVYLQSTVYDVLKEGDAVRGLLLATNEGPLALTARITVDATGDAVVSYLAGAAIEKGRDDGLMQPVTLEFTIDGVDDTRGVVCIGDVDEVELGGERFLDFCRRCADEGKLPQKLAAVRLHPTTHAGQRQVNTTQVNGVDSTRVDHLFRAEVELRQQIGLLVDFFRTNLPGYEQCRCISSGTTVGVRESRRVMGDYVITAEELAAGKRFDDAVVHPQPCRRRSGRGADPILRTLRPALPLLHAARRREPLHRGPLHLGHAPRPCLLPRHVDLHGHGRGGRHRRGALRPQRVHAPHARRGGAAADDDRQGHRTLRLRGTARCTVARYGSYRPTLFRKAEAMPRAAARPSGKPDNRARARTSAPRPSP